jgi:hypothetical protein
MGADASGNDKMIENCDCLQQLLPLNNVGLLGDDITLKMLRPPVARGDTIHSAPRFLPTT